MRYLMLSDIHANMDAFDAAMAEAEGRYDEAVCLGDIVGYGPEPNEAVERVRALEPSLVVRGNHDKAGCGITDAEDFNHLARQAAMWTRGQLTEENLAYLRGLPQGPLSIGGFQVVHGSPRDEDEYLLTPVEVAANFEFSSAPLLFFGHTHMQGGFLSERDGVVRDFEVVHSSGVSRAEFALEEGTRYFINPGSIGQPRDGDPRSGFAIYDGDHRVVEYFRLPYAVERVQAKIEAAGLPEPLGARLASGH